MALVLTVEHNNNNTKPSVEPIAKIHSLYLEYKTWQYLVQNRISFSVAFAAKSSKGRAALDIEAEGVKLFSKASEVWQ